jgi:hypothetical protein
MFRPLTRNPLLNAGLQKGSNTGVFQPEVSEIPKTVSYPDVTSWADDNGGNDAAHFGRISGIRVDDTIYGYAVQWRGAKGAGVSDVVVRCALYAADPVKARLTVVPGSKTSATFSAAAGAGDCSVSAMIPAPSPFRVPTGRPIFAMFNSTYDSGVFSSGVVPHASPAIILTAVVPVTSTTTIAAGNLFWDMAASDFGSDGFPVDEVGFTSLSPAQNFMSMALIPTRLVLGTFGLPATSSTLIIAI